MTKVFLKKDTVVNGNVTSETLTVGEQLTVDGNDITIKVPIKGLMKEFKMSKIVEAIMALNERTCMMYPDYEFIKTEVADPTHDNDPDGLPDLTRGLTFEITDDNGEIYSVVLSETNIVRTLRRGNILTSDEINTLINVFNHSDIRPSKRTFISPVIYDNGDTNKVSLKSFQLEGYSTAILPVTDGLYNYNVIEWEGKLQIKIKGNPDSYKNAFISAFVTGMTDDNMTPLLYPIPPLLDGIIYDNEKFKRLSNVIKNNDNEFNGIGLSKVFDIKREGDWEFVSGAIMDINHWRVDDITHIDGYFVRAPESIISAVACNDKLCNFGYQYEILERPVYTVYVYNSSDPILIAENIALDTDYGFEANEVLSPENMEKIRTHVPLNITNDILIGNVIYEYNHDSNTITLVAATEDDTAVAVERGNGSVMFTDTRLDDDGKPLYTYTVTGSEIKVNRNNSLVIDDYEFDSYTLDNGGKAIILITPITKTFIQTQNDANTLALSETLNLNGLFEGITVDDINIKKPIISHWKLDTTCSVNDMFANLKDKNGNAVSVECDVDFVNESMSKSANKLSIELTIPNTVENTEDKYETIKINEIKSSPDSTEGATQFTLSDSLSYDVIEACNSAVINCLNGLNDDWRQTDKYVYMETIPYAITDDVAYIRSFIARPTTDTTVYIDPYVYDLTELGHDLLTITVSVLDTSSYETVQIPPLKNPICTLYGVAETAQGLFIKYDNLAQGSGLNGEIDISHWSLRGVTSIDGAFSGCNSMTKLICEHNDTDWIGVWCDMDSLCSACTSLESVVLDSLPFGIGSIDNAFAGCEKLQNVLITGVSLNTLSFNGVFNGCSYTGGVDVQIYNNESQRVALFTDTFTNVLSMCIKTNNGDLFHDAQNIGWYFDDIMNNTHGFNKCEYNGEQCVISPFVSCLRDTSIASLMEYTEDMTRIDSTSIGPDLDYTGSNVPIIQSIDIVDNETIITSVLCSLEYVTDVLNFSSGYMELLSGAIDNDNISNMLIETLPDHHLTVLNKPEKIILRSCVPSDDIGNKTSPPYIINNDTSQVVFDYSKINNGKFDPPFRRPALISGDSIQRITLSDPDTNISDSIRDAQPIYKHRIVDYTHWDTKTYLTKSVIKNIFGSNQEVGTLLPHTIIAPHISPDLIEYIIDMIKVLGNITEITLYTYTDINGGLKESEYKYQPIIDCLSKINGMQGYTITVKQNGE